MILEFCLEKESCVSNTWLKRDEKRKVIFIIDENETGNNFVLKKKRFIRNMKVIPEEF